MKKLPDDIIHYIMCFEDIVTFTRQGLCNKHMRYLFLIHERKLCKAIINKKVNTTQEIILNLMRLMVL